MFIESLNQQVEIYVPSTNGSKPAEPKLLGEVLNRVMVRMCEMHGGCTVIDAQGGYVGFDKKIIMESVKIVRSNAKQIKREAINSLALYIAAELNQECVAVQINNEFNLIYRAAKAA